MTTVRVIEADLTWTGAQFESGFQLEVAEDGRIRRAGRLGLTPTTRLRGQAMLPGFVNAHSHAFQRSLRGLGERFPAGAGSFWTWRDEMFRAVEEMEPDRFVRVCSQAFEEMRRAGITAVGEFHYLHHTRGTTDFAYDRLIVQAAAQAGIRMVLLNAYYRTGGFGRPLEPAQLRFETTSPEAYWRQQDALAQGLNSALVTLGAVAHSIRSTTPEEIGAIRAEAARRGMVFHLHIEEQRREIEECLAAYGRRPMELLLDHAGDLSGVTAVHCTHTASDTLAQFVAGGGTACICPLTEGNLGDGIPDLSGVPTRALALGTDSNARISMLEEIRWLEYGQRLRREERGAFREEGGHVARNLLEVATSGGAHALGIPAGQFAPGTLADGFSADLGAAALREVREDHLLDAVLFGADDEVILGTMVGGTWRQHREPAR
jgi:formimidoylglutamate deiminase